MQIRTFISAILAFNTLPAAAISANPYERVQEFRAAELSTDEVAERESQLLVEKVRLQVHKIYQAALQESGSSDSAAETVREMMAKDLVLVDASLKEELQDITLRALEDAIRGVSVSETSGSELLSDSLRQVVDVRFKMMDYENMKMQKPKENESADAEKLSYKSKQEILASLASGKQGARWIERGGIDANSSRAKWTDGNFSYRFKVSFMGVALDAGPNIRVSREINTNIKLIAEGQYPISKPNGLFDLVNKDNSGKIIKENGQSQRRYAAFFCEATFNYTTENIVGGGFSVAGVGGNTNRAMRVSESVYMQSRRLVVPDFIENRQVTFQELRQLCQNDYVNAKVQGNMTVKGVADAQIKAQLSGMVFVHPKTTCVTDDHCKKWYKKEKLHLLGNKAFPRCVEDRAEKFRSCIVASSINQACPVFEKGKRVSAGGINENICDRGLKCVTTKAAGMLFWQYAEAKCVPVNPKTYRAPRL